MLPITQSMMQCPQLTFGEANPPASFSTDSCFLWLHDKNVAFSMNIRGMVNHEYNRLLAEKALVLDSIPGGEDFEQLGMDRKTSIVRPDLYLDACHKVMSAHTNDPLSGLNLSTAIFFNLLHKQNEDYSTNIRGLVNQRYNALLLETGICDGKIPGNDPEQLGMDMSTSLNAVLYSKAYGQVMTHIESISRYPHFAQEKFTLPLTNTFTQVESFSWNRLDITIKNIVVSSIINGFENGQTKGVVEINKHNQIIKLQYDYQDAGTTSVVFVVSVAKDSFALKILRPGIELGDSAIKLLNHSIVGLVPLFSSEILDIDGVNRAVITMGRLEETWTSWFSRNAPKLSDLSSFFSNIKRLLEALISLEKEGFVHANIGEQNLMFDKQGHVYIVDIDRLPNVDDEFAWYRRICDIRAIDNLLKSFIYQLRLEDKHPLKGLRKVILTEEEEKTPQAYLFKINKIMKENSSCF